MNTPYTSIQFVGKVLIVHLNQKNIIKKKSFKSQNTVYFLQVP
jgi:hypothetical protein